MKASYFERAVGSCTLVTLPMLGDNYAYILYENRKAIVVDPADAMPVLKFLKKKDVERIYLLATHHHFDHVGGAAELKAETGCRVIGPEKERIPGVDQVVEEGDELLLCSNCVHVIATPGHTPTHVCYYIPDLKIVLTGDTLFTGGCGRLFANCPEVMLKSLMRLAVLPDDTLVFCGHEYTLENMEFAAELEPKNVKVHSRLIETRNLCKAGMPAVPSTMALEKATNPFLRAGEPSLKKSLHMNNSTDVAVFAELRHRKDRYR